MSGLDGLRSPATGLALRHEGHALHAQGERWPVVDGIAFLRADRRSLADAALAWLDAGAPDRATALLLADQDGWARTPPPAADACLALARGHARLSFRQAMAQLEFGAVADYFAHRWSDPTYLSGLALAEAHWPERQGGEPPRVLELACGAGHYLRAFLPHAPAVIGADLVFAKLWLARHFLAPAATLLCFDAAAPWPLPDAAADLLFCHDAFYFLPEKAHVAQEMRRVAARVLVGHAHNAEAENLSAGAPLPVAGYSDLFPGALLYDDDELTASCAGARTPQASDAPALRACDAVALAWRAGQPRCAGGMFDTPAPGAPLRRNPLYAQRGLHAEIAWPSERYAREYAARATYPLRVDAPARACVGDPGVDAWLRARVLLDLPARW